MDLRRLQDDLHGFFEGEAHFDDVTRRLYSTDASIFQVKPAGVVLPRDEADLARLVKYAYEQDIALIARGYRTREMAQLMSLSHKTVEKHRTNLMRKLGLRSAAAVAAYAITHGFV